MWLSVGAKDNVHYYPKSIASDIIRQALNQIYKDRIIGDKNRFRETLYQKEKEESNGKSWIYWIRDNG